MGANDIQTEIARKRSAVRIRVTHYAALFVFAGGALFVGYIALRGAADGKPDISTAKDVFLAIMAAATAILGYWFSDRSASKAREENKAVHDELAETRKKHEEAEAARKTAEGKANTAEHALSQQRAGPSDTDSKPPIESAPQGSSKSPETIPKNS